MNGTDAYGSAVASHVMKIMKYGERNFKKAALVASLTTEGTRWATQCFNKQGEKPGFGYHILHI